MIKSLKRLTKKAGFEYLGKDVSIQSIAINSNQIQQDSLFVAIIANRDGHDFIDNAIKHGAKALLVSKKRNVNIPQIVCPNTIKGLRELAKEYRKSLTMPIISLTGSCGKTSVKEMIVTLLSDKKIHFTQGNLNNYLGVPITILQTPADAEFAVIEAGTNVVGEIKAAADIIQPNIALITNIDACHLENLKSLDGVMQEKSSLLEALSNSGCCIVNLDDKRISNYAKKLSCRKITCSMLDSKADIFVKSYNISVDAYNIFINIFDKEYQYDLAVIGKHNLFNSILAIATVLSTGLAPKEFLQNSKKIRNYKSRFSIQKITSNLTIIDDTYNASILAVRAAINDLTEFNGKKILVITTIRELGNEAENYHRQIGKWLKQANLDKILIFGDSQLTSFIFEELKNDNNLKYYQSRQDLKSDLINLINKYKSFETKVTIKGARAYKMETIVAFLKQNISYLNSNKTQLCFSHFVITK